MLPVPVGGIAAVPPAGAICYPRAAQNIYARLISDSMLVTGVGCTSIPLILVNLSQFTAYTGENLYKLQRTTATEWLLARGGTFNK